MGIGLAFVFLIVPMFVSDHYSYEFSTATALLDSVEHQPLNGVPAFCIAVAGFALITVATRGIFNRYQTPEERFESFFRVYFVELVIFVGVGLVSLGVRDAMWAVPPGLFRLIGLIVGTISAVLLGNQLSFPQPIMQWACVLGGLFGFALGPIFYYLLFFLIIMLFVQPVANQMPGIGRFLPFINNMTPGWNPSRPLINSNQSRIDTILPADQIC